MCFVGIQIVFFILYEWLFESHICFVLIKSGHIDIKNIKIYWVIWSIFFLNLIELAMFTQFAPCMEGNKTDFAPHME